MWPSRISLSILVCNWGILILALITTCENPDQCSSANSEAQAGQREAQTLPVFKGSQSRLGLSLVISS